MYKKFLGIVAVVLSLALSQATFACPWACADGMKKIVNSLQLDDAQKAKIKPILEQLKSTIKENAAQMHDVQAQIKQQVDSATMDQATVNSLVDKKTQLIGNIIKAKLNAKNQILTILNDRQKMQFQNSVQKVRAKMAAKFKNCHQN